jgi:hypothetical protein
MPLDMVLTQLKSPLSFNIERDNALHAREAA